MLQPGSICFRAFFLRLCCATYEPTIPFCGSAVQHTNGAFHFTDGLSSVRTEHSTLQIGCAAYERSVPLCGSAEQRTNGAFPFTDRLCNIRADSAKYERAILLYECATKISLCCKDEI